MNVSPTPDTNQDTDLEAFYTLIVVRMAQLGAPDAFLYGFQHLPPRPLTPPEELQLMLCWHDRDLFGEWDGDCVQCLTPWKLWTPGEDATDHTLGIERVNDGILRSGERAS